jgi:hypothetical protein
VESAQILPADELRSGLHDRDPGIRRLAEGANRIKDPLHRHSTADVRGKARMENTSAVTNGGVELLPLRFPDGAVGASDEMCHPQNVVL